MDKIHIIYLDDQREVLATIGKDLATLEQWVNLEECETVDEAQQLLDKFYKRGEGVAIIISDHIMPGKNGIEFLIEINKDGRFDATKKILLTGMATHQDTITAINNANIHRYIEKPWKTEELVQICRELLTAYLLDTGTDYEPFMPIIDQGLLYEHLRKNP